jgi:hypothetical protein
MWWLLIAPHRACVRSDDLIVVGRIMVAQDRLELFQPV